MKEINPRVILMIFAMKNFWRWVGFVLYRLTNDRKIKYPMNIVMGIITRKMKILYVPGWGCSGFRYILSIT